MRVIAAPWFLRLGSAVALVMELILSMVNKGSAKAFARKLLRAEGRRQSAQSSEVEGSPPFGRLKYSQMPQLNVLKLFGLRSL